MSVFEALMIALTFAIVVLGILGLACEITKK